MDQEMQRNPDYNLVMKFLSSITPGDMDKESADQLMMIGQRIQAGGSLTDKEREMFQSVVGAMPEMREQTGAAMTEAEMEELRMREFNQKLQEQQQAIFDARQREIEAGIMPTGEPAGMTEMKSPMPRMRPSNLGG